MDLSEAFHALGSDARLKILMELMQGDRGISELSRAVGLNPVTVRYHINILLRDGLVERLPQRREGVAGRPMARFRVRPERMGGFPPRRYEMLSEILLHVVRVSLDREQWGRMLYAEGHEKGQQLIEGVEREAQISAWSPQRFVRLCLEGVMADMGVRTKVIDLQDDLVHYRAFTCPFQELALKYPDMICNYLDVGFHEGVAEKLDPDVVHERLACMGHGDPYCEYRIRWTRRIREDAE
ncbi:MAG: helix-turn-helix transcriptional regulator [Thermoplasmata archaeon]